ncbi:MULTISPECIES: nuclear transport factor 2 family protein [unclassified Streptomyces]|uniref:nuclear transport factor 2 family protein n=1 Tax=unclassified Streptomyces TaxID=2593676 RepID=UPI000DC7CF84|nr:MULTISPECIES: nuclear transport factor 2 family protein [unclassified Streptomyces]AWZ09575.1 nuclear transport factor 2 family protein [Streptomyces sp. ICC4]AWZ16986.1 nuclear transport factor 2 family protein [Streptomyces sp. ICC1]
MSEHPDCALIRRGYEAFGKGDMEKLSTMMTADVIQHVPGTSPISGHHKGREAVLDLYRRLGEETNGTMRLHLDKLLADGRGHVMSFHTTRADRGDRGIEIHEGIFFTIVAGKISDLDVCIEDIDEADAFWS